MENDQDTNPNRSVTFLTRWPRNPNFRISRPPQIKYLGNVQQEILSIMVFTELKNIEFEPSYWPNTEEFYSEQWAILQNRL